jgi:tetratricopeptide (TPR) repeat protein
MQSVATSSDLSPWMRISVSNTYDEQFPENFQLFSSVHCTLFVGDLVRKSTCSMNSTRTFADVSSFYEILQNKFPDEHFPAIVISKQQNDASATSSKELFAQRHRLCSEFFNHVCQCHHVMFSKDVHIFLSASAASFRDHVSKVFPEGNRVGFKLFKDAKYVVAKRTFFNACERYKCDADPHAAAISAMYAVEALAMQRYWSDIREAADFCLPIFKSFADIYGVVRALCQLGRACMYLGDTNTAKTCFLEAESVAARYNSTQLRIVVCKHLADFYHRMGDIQESIGLMKREILSFPPTIQSILHLDFKLFLSQLLLQFGSLDESFNLCNEITESFLSLPDFILQGKNPGRYRIWIDDRLHASALLLQSKYYLLYRDIESAEAFAKRAISISRSDNCVGIACWVILGKCDLMKSACNESLKTFDRVSRIPSFAFCDSSLRVQVYSGLILSEFLCGHCDKAIGKLQLLRDSALASFDRLTHAHSLRVEALIAYSSADFNTAQVALEKCLILIGSVFSDFSLRMEACKARLLCSQVYLKTGHYGLALKYLTECMSILDSNNHVDFLLKCRVLRSLGELELLRSKVGEGIRLLEQALDLVNRTPFKYDIAQCVGLLAIGHAMMGDFIRADERLLRMKSVIGGVVNSVSVVYAAVVTDVVRRLQELSASTCAITVFAAKSPGDDRQLTVAISSEHITIFDGAHTLKHKETKKKQSIVLVAHPLDDSVMVALSQGNKKAIVLQGRSSSPMFVFRVEDATTRSIILQLTSCLVSNNRPSPYLTTLSYSESESSLHEPAVFSSPSQLSSASLIPRSMKGSVVPVRKSHLDCQLLDSADGSFAGMAFLSPDPLKSGAYPIRIRPSKQGKLHLIVSLIGQPVVGSPLEINVTKNIPSPIHSSACFFRTALQNETNLFVFSICDHSGSPVEPNLVESTVKFQFRYSNRTAVALELAEVDTRHLAFFKGSQLVSACFPHAGDLLLYVDFFGEGFTPTSITVRCFPSSVSDYMSLSSFDEACGLLTSTHLKNKALFSWHASLLQSPGCRQCFKTYLSFRNVLKALVSVSHGDLLLLQYLLISHALKQDSSPGFGMCSIIFLQKFCSCRVFKNVPSQMIRKLRCRVCLMFCKIGP